jgi:DNA-binding HxlR family transcriptional regulator
LNQLLEPLCGDRGLRYLDERGVLRHGQLRRLIPNITQKMLTQQLRQLEADGIVERTQYDQVPPRVEYALTDYGRSLQQLLELFCDWGQAHAERANLTVEGVASWPGDGHPRPSAPAASFAPHGDPALLLEHPQVREVSVIGRADAQWGEAVVAYVVGEVSAEELDGLCLSRIARFKRPKDYVFVETVGTGQSEVEIVGIADTIVLALMPGSGDSIQALKAGIMEIPDVIAINKRDHPAAKTMLNEVRSILALDVEREWKPPIVLTEAVRAENVAKLWDEVERGAERLLARHQPACVAIEGIFYARNVRSALKLGHARGVALLAASEAHLPVVEYSPAEIKRAVVGYGRAEKPQVQGLNSLIVYLANVVA